MFGMLKKSKLDKREREISLVEPKNFLSNKYTKSLGLFIISVGIIILLLNWERVEKLILTIGNLVVINASKTYDLDGFGIYAICLPFFILLAMSYYLMRSSYFDLDSEKKWTKYTARFAYFMGNLFVVIIEVTLYGLLFMLFFYKLFPEDNKQSLSAIEFLIVPAGLALLFMLVIYGVYYLLMKVLFKRIYGGLLLIEEIRWNKIGMNVIASVLFIIAIISSLVSVVIDDYQFQNYEKSLLFGVYVFTIAIYGIKIVKDAVITHYES